MRLKLVEIFKTKTLEKMPKTTEKTKKIELARVQPRVSTTVKIYSNKAA